jgi:hypothetical protein
MPALIGFCSLAVDYGHARLTKVELQTAADAAARYGVSSIAAGVTTAQNRAIDAADDNVADGTPVVILPADVEFGTWTSSTKTFTVLTGAARASANAMRVTAARTAARGNAVQLGFATVIGKSSVDVTARSIACIDQSNAGGGYGIVGLSFVSMLGNPTIDSFKSAAGPYSAASAGNYGTVISNSWITMTGNSIIKGDVHAGKTAGIVKNGNPTITGSTSNQTSDLSFAMPTTPAGVTNLGNVVVSGTLTLPAGNYYATSFAASGTLNVTGQVTLYVGGTFSISSGALLNVAGNLPKNFRVRMVSSAPVTLGSNSATYADVYAPGSTVTVNGTGDFYGALIAGGLNTSGDAGIHYDESLGYGAGNNGGTGQISLVK